MRISKRKTIFLFLAVSLLIFFQDQVWAQMSHELFTAVLSEHVSDGAIDYPALCRDERLEQYTRQLNATDPETMKNRKDRFAFWLNVYNAYSLQAICRRYPIKSLNDLNFGGLMISVLMKKSVWDRPLVLVNQAVYTLRQVDHEILRPIFKDPRIQFAIACGAIGCAPSRREAYEGGTLDQQLDDQARRFINDPKLNAFDVAEKTARLSPLFNWSKSDFGKNDRELLLYISQYLPEAVAAHLRENPELWKIKYQAYDLRLNDVSKGRAFK